MNLIIVIFLIIGMYMGLCNFSIALFFCIEVFLFFILLKKYSKKIFVIMLILFFSYTYSKLILLKYDNAFCKYEKSYVAEIVSLKVESKNNNKYIAIIKSGKYKNYKIIVYTKEDLEYGSIICFEKTIEKPNSARNDRGFDYAKYLREKKISGIVKLNEFKFVKIKKGPLFYLFIQKEKLCNRLDRIYKRDESSFLKAILFGMTDYLDEEIKDDFKNANISHVLAISGMHISYIVLFLEFFLNLFVKNIKSKNIIIIVFLIMFAIFVGGSNSVLRACIMTSIVYFGKIILKKDDYYSSFIFAIIILIIFNPYNIFSISMWLSFGGSIGIVLYSKIIEKICLRRIYKNFNIKKSFILERIIQTVSVTIGAQIMVLPIIIYVFNNVSLNFVISNLLISELIGPILILGYLSLFLSFLSIFENILIKIFFKFAKFSANIPFGNFFISTPHLFNIFLYYLLLAFLVYIWKYYKIYLFRKIRKHKFSSLLIIIICTIILFNNYSFLLNKEFEIHFLDVGQGDSCLIKTNKNKIILIDGGKGIGDEYDYGKNVILPYLLDHGIKKIDYMIISHFDSDHCGGLFYILENYNVKNVVIGKQFSKYDNLLEFLKILNNKKIKLIIAKSGDSISFDSETNIYVLFPNEENKILENEINNNSLVFKMYYKKFTMLFTGDIEESAEKALINLYGNNLKSDILKVAHHGSKSSSTQKFIELVSPKIALIGVGENNNFGHPSPKILELLNNNHINIYRTDMNGEVSIIINNMGKVKKIQKFLN